MKYKNQEIYQIPKLASLIFPTVKGCLALGKVYLRADFYEKFKTNKTDTQILGYLEHELTHLARTKINGDYFCIKYWLNKDFRLQEEFEATKNEMKIHKSHKSKFDVEKRAETWSSFNYLWMTDYNNALNLLNNEWKKL